MKKIKVCIAGVTGWIGRALVASVLKSSDLALVGAVSRKNSGKTLGEVFGMNDFPLRISESVDKALDSKTDVLVDYTSPYIVKNNIYSAIKKGVNVVVGTSGLSDQDYDEIDKLAKKENVGVFAAGNFAISAALLNHFAIVAAKYMKSWEVIDYASDAKIDAPSGTAYEIAHLLSTVGNPAVKVKDDKVKGQRESRGFNLNGTHVHSVRLPGYVIGVDVIFGGKDEKLTLKFEAGNTPDTYVEGTLLAIRKVIGMVGLTRGLDRLLF